MAVEEVRFRYPVYNPCVDTVDAADDWGRYIFDTTQDLELVRSMPFRVAAVPIFFDRPGFYAYQPGHEHIDLTDFDLVLVSDPEYYPLEEIRAWINSKAWRQHVLALGGWSPSQPQLRHNELYRPYYIRRFLDTNCYQDNQRPSKEFLFDALLGARRPHRDYVMRALDRSGLLADSIVTYRDCFPGELINAASDRVKEIFPHTALRWPYVSENLDPAWEVSPQVNNQISFISPIEIYQRCWYTITCETINTGNGFFLSEKTIKAMFNARIFVLFGAQNFLANLRGLHDFATFDGIIDETYDSESDDYRRYMLAMQQIFRLAWFEDPVMTYQCSQDRLERNRQRLVEVENKRRWDMRDLLHRMIPGQHWLY